MTPLIGFLHTQPANRPTFASLLRQLDPGIGDLHLVDETLIHLTRAAGGITAQVQQGVQDAVDQLAGQGAQVIVCTCSSIGPAAEAASAPPGTTVMRIDRPMAEQAVTLGPQVLVVAALDTTLFPTRALLQQAASEAGRPLVIQELVCAGAWPFFQQGDLPGYYRQIARAISGSPLSRQVGVVVLAQASMAGAADLLTDLGVPVLASPQLGLAAAVASINRSGG